MRLLPLSIADRTARVTRDTWGEVDGVPLAPFGVEIQPTAHCHRTCSFCSHIIRNRRGGALSAEDVDRLLAECKELGVRRIAFSGGGEPLYWAAGNTVTAVERAATFADVSLTTSGDQLWDAVAGLHPDAVRLLEHCSTMYLNIPAVDERNFARQVRGPSGWEHASAMLRGLVQLRATAPARFRCQLHAVVVLSAFNVDQVADIDRTLFDHGVDRIYYKQWKNFEERNIHRVRLEDEHIAAVLGAIPAGKRSADLDAFLDGLVATFEPEHCWSNRIGNDAIVDPNGDVYLCTPTVGQVQLCVGNLDEGGLTAVWLGARRRAVLAELDSMALRGACPRDCRHHPDNARIAAAIGERS